MVQINHDFKHQLANSRNQKQSASHSLSNIDSSSNFSLSWKITLSIFQLISYYKSMVLISSWLVCSVRFFQRLYVALVGDKTILFYFLYINYIILTIFFFFWNENHYNMLLMHVNIALKFTGKKKKILLFLPLPK